MASQLSDEEFQRLQTQLIELRTANYGLEEQCRKLKMDNQGLLDAKGILEKEHQKLQKTITKNKKAKDIDILIRENEILLQKLHVQEEDFHLQNQTLLQELASVVAAKDSLEEELSVLRDQDIKRQAQVAVLSQLEWTEIQEALQVLSTTDRDHEMLRNAKQKLEHLEAHHKKYVESLAQVETEKLERQRIEDELSHAQDKLRMKQESLMDSRRSYEELRLRKEEEICTLKQHIHSLQNSQQTKKVQADEHVLELQAKLIELECLLEEAKKKLQQKENVEAQLQQAVAQHKAAASHWEQQKTALEEVHELAQKRKKFVDEMSIRIEQKSNELTNLTNEFSNKEEKLKQEIKTLQEEVEKLSPLQAQLEDAMMQIKSLEGMSGWLDRRKKEAEGVVEHLKTEHAQQLEQMKLSYEQQEQVLKDDLEAARCEIKTRDETITTLEQQVHDTAEEKLLAEKKVAAVMKDLRRQLAAERKRAEKLQERLKDVLNESTHTKSDLCRSNDPETSSLSSWSLMSGNCESSTRENSMVAGSINQNGNVSPPPEDQDLEQENYQLLNRITELQKEKWVLEEKINHLEQGCSAMAEDLMHKTELIQFYCMERRPDPVATSSSSPSSERLTMKKFVEIFKGDEHVHESNRRMQRMLEEMLTKNMHLQCSLQQLSEEVARLSSIK